VSACLACLLAVAAGAEMPTPEQLQRLQDLTPEEQAQLTEAMKQKQGSSVDQAPLNEPRLVVPLPPDGDRTVPDELLEPAAEQPGSSRKMPGERPGQAETRRAGAGDRDRERGEPAERDTRRGDIKRGEMTRGRTTQGEKPRGEKPLSHFGYDLFAGAPTTFAPATDIPIDADYVMGPGDTVKVQLFGKQNIDYNLVVSREGQLLFPRLGPVSVAGLTFKEMQEVLKAHIEKQLIGEQAVITLGTLRSIRVFVLGEAKRPGSYTVSALSTLTNALFVSGGIKEIGSLRNIQLKRNGRIVARLDLYDLLLRGDTSHDARLQPGDVIFVPPVGATVGVAGEVRRPAIYELKTEKSVQQALDLAGGLLPTAYPQASQIERINRRGERTLVDVDLDSKAALAEAVQAGDTLHVYSILEKMEDIVLLSGHVQRPGAYQWRAGMHVADLIPSIENGLLPRPDLDYALVKRELPPDHRIQVFSIRLGDALQHPASAANVALRSRDEVIVFDAMTQRTEVVDDLVSDLKDQASFQQPAKVVQVGGLVRHPGDYPLEPSMRVSDLIRAGGGLAEAAYALGAELTRYDVVDGSYREVAHLDVDLGKLLAGDRSADLALQAHDVLHIKRLPEWATAASVEIFGEVRFPGVYPISRGEQLSKLLERAGGLTDMAFPQGAVFIREELRKREQQRLQEMSRRLEADLASLSLKLAQEGGGKAESLEIVRELGNQLRDVEPTGRLVIDLPKLIKDTRDGRRSDYDVTLADGDRLYIPTVTQEVTVTGEVFYPTSHLYTKGYDRDRYIGMSGGPTQKADTKRVYVIRADGSVESGGKWFDASASEDISPGDTIVVPLDVDRVRPITLWTNVSQIIYQLAIAAASANAVGVF
jgi:protein involved in polysaccharide export with SLBB domain